MDGQVPQWSVLGLKLSSDGHAPFGKRGGSGVKNNGIGLI